MHILAMLYLTNMTPKTCIIARFVRFVTVNSENIINNHHKQYVRPFAIYLRITFHITELNALLVIFYRRKCAKLSHDSMLLLYVTETVRMFREIFVFL
jgi:hypothetical protein